VEDAVTTLLNGIYKHLETPASYVRILFADFSSAFNTIQSYLLIEKLTNMDVNLNLFNRDIVSFKNHHENLFYHHYLFYILMTVSATIQTVH